MAGSTLRMRPILPVLFALTVLVAACGGSDGDAKSGGQPAKAEQALRVALIPNQEPTRSRPSTSRLASTRSPYGYGRITPLRWRSRAPTRC